MQRKNLKHSLKEIYQKLGWLRRGHNPIVLRLLLLFLLLLLLFSSDKNKIVYYHFRKFGHYKFSVGVASLLVVTQLLTHSFSHPLNRTPLEMIFYLSIGLEILKFLMSWEEKLWVHMSIASKNIFLEKLCSWVALLIERSD